MVTNREDFVISIRSVFLKKDNQQRFSLIALITFSLIFLILGKLNFKAIDYVKITIREIVYRSSFIVSAPENYLKNTYQNVQNHFIIYKDYFEIKSELEKFKLQNSVDNFIIEENKRLKKIIDDYVEKSDEIVAKVLIDKKSPFLRSIILNKGTKDKVELGMAVLDGSYLVGKIVETNYSTSRALLISDLNSKIPVAIEPGNIQSILSGTGKSNGKIQYLQREGLIEKTSIVYTSGSGGLFKSGIPIGKINKFAAEDENFVKYFSNLSQLTFVKLVSFKKEIN